MRLSSGTGSLHLRWYCAEILTRKPVEPTAQEVKTNSPSRSAKLRVVRKIHDASAQHFMAIEEEAM